MRRIRKVHIIVSENFYNKLEATRKDLSNKMSQKIGIPKSLTFLSMTELISQNSKFPKINIRSFNNVKKKRRCI